MCTKLQNKYENYYPCRIFATIYTIFIHKMILLRNLSEVNSLIENLKNEAKEIGFVPTMGALHAGHISLISKAAQENDFTFVTIFVNPTQFNNAEDLINYPRTEEADLKILENSGCNAVYFPSVSDIYPEGEKSQSFEFGGLEKQMEGAFRPGHFDGVATVIQRFFEIVQPTRAYFGEKDFQQLRIIQELVPQIHSKVQIVPVPILREDDGLAMSSRNMRLTQEFRSESPIIYKILSEAKNYFQSHSVEETKQFVENAFAKTNLKLEYFEIADEATLLPATNLDKDKKLRGFVAVYAGDIRLIDNISLN